MKFELQLFRKSFPLITPYKLSFGTLDAYDTFFVVVKNNNVKGIGEITLLEGYGSEDFAGVVNAIRIFAETVNRDKKNIWTVLREIHSVAPFTASGIASAIEIFLDGGVNAFFKSFSSEIPLVAFCFGDNLEQVGENAEKLVDSGFKTLKIKVGKFKPSIEADLAQAALARLPGDGKLRLDANQNLSFWEAYDLCSRLEDLDGSPKIHFLEQPFKPDDWAKHERLIQQVGIPIMLDESVWKTDDIRRAKDCGANFVKLKLCKHLGIEETSVLIRQAREYRLGVVFGNGVQSGFGNYLESKIYLDTGLETAFEGNGFLKLKNSTAKGSFTVRKGEIIMNGKPRINDLLSQDNIISHYDLSCTPAAFTRK